MKINKGEKIVTRSIILTENNHDMLRLWAFKLGVNQSYLIRRALVDLFAKLEKEAIEKSKTDDSHITDSKTIA